MASSSSSSNQKRFNYDVFLSFSGEDTRKTFVDHLYHALVNRGIITYKDDEKIEKGERIGDELIRSIEESRVHIIVFSKNYASSSWCLDELVKIMECQKMTEHTAYPVFYDVEPSEVRKQRGAVGKAFAKHVNKEAAGRWRWRDALKEAADLAGWELKNTADGHDSKLIQRIVEEIVEEISLKLRYANSSVIENLVGMETRVKNVVSSLDIDADDVRMIGIKGMGGAGKTTLARAVFDHISIMYEGKSFVENVREVSKDSLSGLKALQKQLLKDVLNDRNIDVTSVSDGKSKMKIFMPRRKVLLVLDDVDDKDQLEALAGEPSWFKPGSRIIITTRDGQVLAAHQTNFIHDVNLLSHEEAICLFSKYAFGREIPIQRYEKLSEAVVKYAAGLPLTIKVLGSYLCGKIESEWEHAIERLKSVPLKETLEKLELSYDSLGDDDKELFLDIACMLKGETKEKAIRVLESCGFRAQDGLRVLEQKSLTTISNDGRLLLHDHLEEMGKNIVRRLHPDEPKRHNRLWNKEEIEDILVDDLGTKATRSIKLSYTHLDPYVIMKGLSKMKKLRLLHVNNGYTTDVYTSPSDNNYPSFPNALKYLYWRNYSLSYLPKVFQANHLVNLEMPHSNISQLWEGKERKILNKLRFLDLTFSRVRTFNLGLTPHLEELNLRGCNDFVELHIPAKCPKLKYLDLGGSKVSNLNLRLTPHLVELNLRGCNDLVELHMPIECPRLKYLDLAGSKVSNLNLGLTPHLKELDLRGCNDFVELHMPGGCPNLECLDLGGSKVSNFNLGLTPNLKSLYLGRCNEFVELHMPSECPKLKDLDLSVSKVRYLNLGLTPNLKSLYLGSCNEFVELHMPIECPNLKDLYLGGSKLSNLNLGLTPHLEILDLRGCNDFVKLHLPVECPNLKYLDLGGSKVGNLNLELTPHLEELNLEGCTNFVELHMPVECPKLMYLNISGSKVSTLNLGLTPHLERLNLRGCNDFMELHMLVECPKLKYLDLSGSKVSNLNLGLTPNLETLHLGGCNDFAELHMIVECPNLEVLYLGGSALRTFDLGLTPHLKMLDLRGCNDFVELYMPVECPNLKYLDLGGSRVCNLNLALTPNLEVLHLGGCNDFVGLHMPVECPNLEVLYLGGSKLSYFNLGLTPHLEMLDLRGCNNFIDLNMPIICSKLKYLNLSGSKLSNLNLEFTPYLEELHLEECNDLVDLHVPIECPKLKFLGLSGSKVSSLNLRLTPHLERLDLKNCYHLQEIHAPVGCLKMLVFLNLSGCSRFEYFVVDKGIELLSVESLAKLELVAEVLDICPLHPSKNLPKFRFKCKYDEPLLSWSGNLEKLISFGLCACTNLESFSARLCDLQELGTLKLEGSISEVPKNLHQLESLEELSLSMEKIKHLPDSICLLKHLKSIELKSCFLLDQLPKDLGSLECLEKLHLSDCISLPDIPSSICKMRYLKYLHLPYCVLVKNLPDDIGRLESLKELNIEGTGINHLPDSIFQLKDLCIVWSRGRLESYGFTSLKKLSRYTASCHIKNRKTQQESPQRNDSETSIVNRH